MKRFSSFVFLFLILWTDVLCQVSQSINSDNQLSKFDEWIEGTITFKDGQTRFCEFSYNPLVPEGILKIKDNEKIITGTVYNVTSFSYFSKDRIFEHRYFSVPINLNNRVFLEFIYDNSEITLFGRKSLRIDKRTGNNNYSTSTIKGIYQVYILNKSSGNALPITSKMFLKMMKDKRIELMNFVNINNIKFANAYDYLKVIDEYRRLKE